MFKLVCEKEDRLEVVGCHVPEEYLTIAELCYNFNICIQS